MYGRVNKERKKKVQGKLRNELLAGEKIVGLKKKEKEKK